MSIAPNSKAPVIVVPTGSTLGNKGLCQDGHAQNGIFVYPPMFWLTLIVSFFVPLAKKWVLSAHVSVENALGSIYASWLANMFLA